MELIPLVKLTLIVFSSAVAVFIIGSFLVYKIKDMITGSKKENPFRNDRSNTAMVQSKVVIPVKAAVTPQAPKIQQQAPVAMPQPQIPQFHNNPATVRQSQVYYQQQRKPSPPNYPPSQNHLADSHGTVNSVQYLKKKATGNHNLPDHGYYRTSRAQSKVYQQIVRSRKDRIQIVNNQAGVNQPGALAVNARPFYHPRTAVAERSNNRDLFKSTSVRPQSASEYISPLASKYSQKNDKLRKLTIIR